MNIIDTIRKKVPENCIAKKCRKQGCSVPLGRMMQDSILIDMDEYVPRSQRNQARCDYLFVHRRNRKTTWIAPLELKKGNAEVGEVVRQIRAGAEHADRIVPKVNDFEFAPAVFCGRINPHTRAKFREEANYVSFRGQKEPVRVSKCGTPLAKALEAKP